MNNVAAYALLVLGGKADPSAADVTKVLTDAGASTDKDAVALLVKELAGKSFHEIVATGMEKLSASGPKAGPVAEVATKETAKAAEPEAKPESEEEDEGVDGMGGLFGDDEY
jgi:large subunit ribosomal protein LP2